MLLVAIRAHCNRSSKMTSFSKRASKLFGYYVVVMVMLTLYEVWFKYIPFLFGIVVVSGFGQVLQIYVLLKYISRFWTDENDVQITTYGFFMAYFILAVVACIPGEWPGYFVLCTEEQVIPRAFIMYLVIQILLFLYTWFLYCNNYYLDP